MRKQNKPMRKFICFAMSALIVLTMMPAMIPSVSVVAAAPPGITTTYYFAAGGNDNNPGTQAQPKQNLNTAMSLLAPGVAILFNKGDSWYNPLFSFEVKNKGNSASAPMYIGAYGTGSNPVIAAMSKYDFASWSNQGNNVYRITPNSTNVFRAYAESSPLTHVANAAALTADHQWTVDTGYLYVKDASFATGKSIEAIENNGSNAAFLTMQNVYNFTMEDIILKGSSNIYSFVGISAPSKNINFKNCTLTEFLGYGLGFGVVAGTTASMINENILLENCTVDRTWTTDLNAEAAYTVNGTSLGAAGGQSGGDGILFKNAVNNATVRGCTVANMGHSTIGNEMGDISGGLAGKDYFGTKNIVIEKNTFTGGNSAYVRGFGFAGSASQVTNIIIRQNYFYKFNISNHFGGYKNYLYSNIFDTTNDTTVVSPSGFVIDTMIGLNYNSSGMDYVMKDCVIANNTFHDADHFFRYQWPAGDSTILNNNTMLNNIMDTWRSSSGNYNGHAVVMHFTYQSWVQFLNNGFWKGAAGATLYYNNDTTPSYNLAAMNALANCEGNLEANPAFVGGTDYNASNFALSSTSPYKDGGLNLSSYLPAGVAAVDFYGNAFPASPSLGAIQYNKTYYLDDVASNGDGSFASPWNNLQSALNSLTKGDTLYIRAGTHSPTTVVNVTTVATANLPIRIMAYPGETPVFSFSGITATGERIGLYLNGAQYWTFKGISVTGCTSYSTTLGSAIKMNNTVNCTMDQMNVYSNSCRGIRVTGTTGNNNIIQNCDVYSNVATIAANAGISVSLTNASGTTTIQGCRVYSNNDIGIETVGVSGTMVISGNYAWSNGQATNCTYGTGYRLNSAATMTSKVWTFTYNIAVGNYKNGVDGGTQCKAALTASHNTTYGNNTGGGTNYGLKVSTAPTTGTHKFYNNAVESKSLVASQTEVGNSWNVLTGARAVASTDFVSVSTSDALGARQSDGAPPAFKFMMPVYVSGTPSNCLYDFGSSSPPSPCVLRPDAAGTPDIGAVERYKTFYVDGSVSVAGNGTQVKPYKDISALLAFINGGDTLYVAGGQTYTISTAITLTTVGTASKIINVFAYNGTPSVSFSGITGAVERIGIYLNGAQYWYFKGIKFTGNTSASGPNILGTAVKLNNAVGCKFEQCLFSSNDSRGAMVDGASATGNTFLNCDFSNNTYSVQYGQQGVSGLAITNMASTATLTVDGCRFWSNSDIGIDMQGANAGTLTLQNNFAWSNGVASCTSGAGIKLSSSFTMSTNWTINYNVCVNNYGAGIDGSGTKALLLVSHNTTYGNNTGNVGAVGMFFNNTPTSSTYKFYNNAAESKNISASQTEVGNSWNTLTGGRAVASTDFISVDTSLLSASRQSDGAVPVFKAFMPVYASTISDCLYDNGSSSPPTGCSLRSDAVGTPDIGAFEHYKTFYVDGSATANGNGTQTKPYNDLGAVLACLNAGDTLNVKGGVTSAITSQVTLTAVGTSLKPITVQAYGTGTPVVDLSGITVSGVSGEVIGLYLNGAQYWSINDLKLVNLHSAGTTLGTVIKANNAANLTLDELVLENNDTRGIYATGSTAATINECDIGYSTFVGGNNHAGANAIFLDGTTSASTISSCRLYNNADTGINTYAVPATLTITKNWVWNNGKIGTGNTGADGKGMYFSSVWSMSGVTWDIKYNLVYGNRGVGIDGSGSRASYRVQHNTAYNNGWFDFYFTFDITGSGTVVFYNNAGASTTLTCAPKTEVGNSWSSFTLASADFVSTDTSLALTARNADGTLPTTNFLKPAAAPTGRLVDAGSTNPPAGCTLITYNGTAPDLGAIET